MKGAIQLTKRIAEAAHNLNDLLKKAGEMGLRVEIDPKEMGSSQQKYKSLEINVFEKLSADSKIHPADEKPSADIKNPTVARAETDVSPDVSTYLDNLFPQQAIHRPSD